MKYNELKKIKKNYFNYQDIARILGISEASAKVLATRYVKQDYLIRLKRNLYILKERWSNLSNLEKMEIANILQVPSYLSLMTALSYYEITTQLQRDFFESISLQRTFSREIDGAIFNYSKIKREYYFGFRKEKNIFIALPEKALIDSLYLSFHGKYHLDISSLDFRKIDLKIFNELIQVYPDKFVSYVRRIVK